MEEGEGRREDGARETGGGEGRDNYSENRVTGLRYYEEFESGAVEGFQQGDGNGLEGGAVSGVQA